MPLSVYRGRYKPALPKFGHLMVNSCVGQSGLVSELLGVPAPEGLWQESLPHDPVEGPCLVAPGPPDQPHRV